MHYKFQYQPDRQARFFVNGKYSALPSTLFSRPKDIHPISFAKKSGLNNPETQHDTNLGSVT